MQRNARAIGTLGIVLSVCAGVLLSAHPAFGQTDQPVVVAVELSGVVDPIIADHIVSAIDRANADGADAVLLTIDTPGGLGSSMDEIDQAILNSPVPVIGYVAPIGARAASAGAFILLSCPVAAMAPGTNVGASTPIGLSGGDLAKKVQNDAQASIRKLAQTYGRNQDVAESFVRDANSITAEEALAAGVIDLIAPTTDDLLTQLDGQTITLASGATTTLHTANATIEEDPMGVFTSFLHGLLNPDLAFIFFWLGLALIVLFVIVPSHIISGLVGLVMLVTAFVSFGALPVRLIGIVLLIVSVIGFVLELKAPGLGIWGAIGLIALVLGGWYLYDRSGGVEVSPGVLVAVAIGAGLFFGLVVAKAMQIRNMPPAQVRVLVGKEGVALSAGVGPNGGQVRVSAEQWQAVAPGGPIPGGAAVRVTSLDGLVLTVEPAPSEHETVGLRAPAEEGGTTV
ncbi:MAG: nodulation protein NfeD [Actinomycetota bacterium]